MVGRILAELDVPVQGALHSSILGSLGGPNRCCRCSNYFSKPLRAARRSTLNRSTSSRPDISRRACFVCSRRLAFPETRAQQFGDVVVLYGRYEAVIQVDGAERTLRGRLTEMFVRRDGRWLHPGWHLDMSTAPGSAQ